MRCADLVGELPVRLVAGDLGVEITDITDDSRTVRPGAMFVARPGRSTDGARFIEDAVRAGAVAVVSCETQAVAAILAERFHGEPSRALTLIGVTGTNGKTTTTYLVRQLLEHAGRRCGLLGTVEVDDGTECRRADLTTPSPFEISRLVRHMVDAGCDACVMEVSSHALEQGRASALAFDAAVFTNLSGDHLDYHGSMEAYAAAKARLFSSLDANSVAVINVDDAAAARMIAATVARLVTTTATQETTAVARVEVGRETLTGLDARFDGPWGMIETHVPLVGRFNAVNALQALAACHALGLDGEVLARGLGRCIAPPGRLEPVTGAEHDFAVLVDYAHTDDALDNVLRALRPVVPDGGRLRVVFGCGGDRDRSKRPRMAGAAWRWADDVIITSDNPRTEDPVSIIDEVRAGVPDERRDATACEADRRVAIAMAIDRAGAGDVVLIAGKGHEDYQVIGTEKRPFDDRAIARAALEGRR